MRRSGRHALFHSLFPVLLLAGLSAIRCGAEPVAAPSDSFAPMPPMDNATFKDWLARWQSNILRDANNRYCDKAEGEDIGWLVTPFVEGFRNGYLITGDTAWLDRLIDWTDSWTRRGVKEPDGFPGWPKLEAAGTQVDDLNSFKADSLLGEAMALRPAVLFARDVLADPALEKRYGDKARAYLDLSKQIYKKWDQRGAWRDTDDGGSISVVLPFGIDSSGRWTPGYEHRLDETVGFSHPENKANLVARWLLAMSDATQDPAYANRAAKWFHLFSSRITTKADGTFEIWNYWQPAGLWDYKPDGSPKHWVGVHPNKGYYDIDATAIVDAFHHQLVDAEMVRRLIATARATGRYWPALAPYDSDIRRHVEATLRPDSWGGMSEASEYLALQAHLSDSPHPAN